MRSNRSAVSLGQYRNAVASVGYILIYRAPIAGTTRRYRVTVLTDTFCGPNFSQSR